MQDRSRISVLAEKSREKTKWHDAHNIIESGLFGYGLWVYLTFRNSGRIEFCYELLKEKSNLFTLGKFFHPANVTHRFTLVIECREQDTVEFLENHFLRSYSDDIDISLLQGHESEIDKMMPI